MIKFVCNDYNEMSRLAAEIVAGQITAKRDSVLGLPAGSTPVGMYMELVKKKLDYKNIIAFNLGEYYPISKRNNLSYYNLLHEIFFNKINIRRENIRLFDGETSDPDEECRKFEEDINRAGGLDLIVLGIGSNCHIGFNEPSDKLVLGTHVNDLTPRTIKESSKFFATPEETPRRSMTMGMGTIFAAKKILLLANGSNKADAVAQMFSGRISTRCPATLLNLHHDVTIILDSAAAAKI
ncbi:MAG: Glucosamine-6-phosphate deaminase 1 [Firmicutes bacterium ADurb.Bin193]|nr:MAG: Glucosamine-6-phosphate deaminase 1 [Firmicutes bacterium ADurb.Bin193]